METQFYKKLKSKVVLCETCNHFCSLRPGEIGRCGTRQNQDGKLISLVYGKISALNIDPIEKKPLYHFLPGSLTYSIGTIGCNFACLFCQNWELSQISKKEPPLFAGSQEERLKTALNLAQNFSPKEIVLKALEKGCQSIAYTYNEPTVFCEFAFDTAKEAQKVGLKNVWVSNGFFSKKVFSQVKKYVEAINIDLKNFSEKTYKEVCSGGLKPVLENIEALVKAGVWVEVTTLLIPKLNSSTEELKKIASFLASLSKDIPWHISAYYPAYLAKWPPTSLKELEKAYEIGKEAGLKYVYLGNIRSQKENTYCPKCKALLIEREGYLIVKNEIKDSKCPYCGAKIAGVWE